MEADAKLLLGLPATVFRRVIDEVFGLLGLRTTLKLRLVSVLFDDVILDALLALQVTQVKARVWNFPKINNAIMVHLLHRRVKKASGDQSPMLVAIRHSAQTIQGLSALACSNGEEWILHAICSAAVGQNFHIPTKMVDDMEKPGRELSTSDSALIAAFVVMDWDLVTRLTSEGANVNVSSAYSGSPLKIAVRMESLEAVALLLEKGANPTFTGSHYDAQITCLDIVCENDLGSILDLFLNPRRGFKFPSKHLESAALSAARAGNVEILKRILDTGDFTSVTGLHLEMLELACRKGHFETVRAILERYPDIDINAVRPRLPPTRALETACLGGNTDIIRLLFKKGANLNYLGRTFEPLTCAAERGRFDIVDILLERGVNINTAPSLHPPIYAAAQANQVEMLLYLISRGADANHDGYGHDALWDAVGRGRLGIARILLEQGVDASGEADEMGMPPIANAFLESRTESIELLSEFGAKWVDPKGKHWEKEFLRRRNQREDTSRRPLLRP